MSFVKSDAAPCPIVDKSEAEIAAMKHPGSKLEFGLKKAAMIWFQTTAKSPRFTI
jgi:hypothetical protein